MKIIQQIIIAVSVIFASLYMFSSFYSDGRLLSSLYDSMTKNDTARIDIQNFDGAQILIGSPEQYKKIDYPVWCVKSNGESCAVLEFPIFDEWQTVEIDLYVIHPGTLKIALKGPYKILDGKTYPIYVNYRRFKVENNEIITKIPAVWHNHDYEIPFEAVGGNEMHFKIEARKYRFSFSDIFSWDGFDLKRFCLVIVGTLAFLGVVKLILICLRNKFKLPEYEMLFVGLILLLLILPSTNIRQDDINLKENRTLAQLPSLFVKHRFNTKFGLEFNNWFSDRFWGRESMISLYNYYSTVFNKGTYNRILGKNGWFFYRDDEEFDTYTNKTLFSDAELHHIAAYLQDIDNWCRKHHKYFVFMIAPERHKIYGEYYPDNILKIRDDSQSRALQLMQYLQENTQIEALYPLEKFKKLKNEGWLYYKDDIHWTDLGAYYAYRQIIENISRNFMPLPDIEKDNVGLMDMIRSQINPDGKREEAAHYVNYKLSYDGFNCLEKERSENYNICKNPHRQASVFLIRDSFTSPMMAYFNDTFGTMYLKDKWNYWLNEKDIKLMQESDIVIMTVLERRLPNLKELVFPETE